MHSSVHHVGEDDVRMRVGIAVMARVRVRLGEGERERVCGRGRGGRLCLEGECVGGGVREGEALCLVP